MNETDKRIRSWGLDSQCKLLRNGAEIIDLGKLTHLSYPQRRGIHIAKNTLLLSEQEALYASDQLRDETCLGVKKTDGASVFWLGEDCPFEHECVPEKAAVKTPDNTAWRPAIRPRHQKP